MPSKKKKKKFVSNLSCLLLATILSYEFTITNVIVISCVTHPFLKVKPNLHGIGMVICLVVVWQMVC
jgi:hypothetical protein